MVQVINKSQQLLKAAVYPISAYSRVVSCRCFPVFGAGWTGGWTLEVGNRVWLQRVIVKLKAKPNAHANYTSLRILTGNAEPQAVADLWNWDNIIPIWDTGNRIGSWEAYDGLDIFDWTMSMLFKGEHRRFGVLANRGVAAESESVQVSFQIAEG